MLQTLRAARWSGYLRPDVDLPVLADRIVPDHAAGRSRRHPLQRQRRQGRRPAVPNPVGGTGQRFRPPMPQLDRSAAFIAADDVVKSWSDDADAEPDDKAAHVRAVARAEFGRKGYEVTTIRDIASAAQLGTGTVYRLIGSKDRTAGVDHAVVRREGRRRVDGRAALGFVADREARRAELGQHQRPRPLRRRVPHSAGVDATVAPGHPESRLAVRQAACGR